MRKRTRDSFLIVAASSVHSAASTRTPEDTVHPFKLDPVFSADHDGCLPGQGRMDGCIDMYVHGRRSYIVTRDNMAIFCAQADSDDGFCFGAGPQPRVPTWSATPVPASQGASFTGDPSNFASHVPLSLSPAALPAVAAVPSHVPNPSMPQHGLGSSCQCKISSYAGSWQAELSALASNQLARHAHSSASVHGTGVGSVMPAPNSPLHNAPNPILGPDTAASPHHLVLVSAGATPVDQHPKRARRHSDPVPHRAADESGSLPSLPSATTPSGTELLALRQSRSAPCSLSSLLPLPTAQEISPAALLDLLSPHSPHASERCSCISAQEQAPHSSAPCGGLLPEPAVLAPSFLPFQQRTTPVAPHIPCVWRGPAGCDSTCCPPAVPQYSQPATTQMHAPTALAQRTFPSYSQPAPSPPSTAGAGPRYLGYQFTPGPTGLAVEGAQSQTRRNPPSDWIESATVASRSTLRRASGPESSDSWPNNPVQQQMFLHSYSTRPFPGPPAGTSQGWDTKSDTSMPTQHGQAQSLLNASQMSGIPAAHAVIDSSLYSVLHSPQRRRSSAAEAYAVLAMSPLALHTAGLASPELVNVLSLSASPQTFLSEFLANTLFSHLST